MSIFHLFVQHPYWYISRGQYVRFLEYLSILQYFYSRSTLRRAFFLFARFAWGQMYLPLLIMVHLNHSRWLPSHILSFQCEINIFFELPFWLRFLCAIVGIISTLFLQNQQVHWINHWVFNGFVKMRKSIFGMKKHPQISNIYSWCGEGNCTSPLVQRCIK